MRGAASVFASSVCTLKRIKVGEGREQEVFASATKINQQGIFDRAVDTVIHVKHGEEGKASRKRQIVPKNE